MSNFAKSLLTLALAAAATPSLAAQIVFTGGVADGGYNSRIFTAGSGAEAISVRVSAWKLTGSTVTAANLGLYGTAGLGARNNVEGTESQAQSNSSHTVDNLNGYDFLILQFSKKVLLTTATFSAYKQTGQQYTDTDATIGWGNLAPGALWDDNIGIANSTQLNTLIATGNRYTSGNNGSKGTNTRNIDPLLHTGNVWLVGAAMDSKYGGDKIVDSFKFNYLNYTTKMPVPEPATWIMMIAGFGMIGSAMRRRRSVTATVEAAS